MNGTLLSLSPSRRQSHAVMFAVLLACTCFNVSAKADNPLSLSTPASAPAALPGSVDFPRWSFELLGAGVIDTTGRNVGMGGARLGIGYYLYDTVALRTEFTAWGVADDPKDTAAVAASFGLRHHLLKIGKDSSLFVDVAGGIFEAGRRVPERGTDFNFTFDTGFGIDHPLAPGLDLVGGVRYFHLSNAHLKGPDRNPSVNGPEMFVGLMFRR